MSENAPSGTVNTVPNRNVGAEIVEQSPFELGGYSYDFNGSTDFLKLNGDDSWTFGTGDFTIEWFQCQTDTSSFPRVFAIGNYKDENISIAFSNEGGAIYVWLKSGNNFFGSLNEVDYKNQWVHFAIVRNSGNLYLYKNGVQQGNPIGNSDDITDNTTALYFGVETETTTDSTWFGGYLSNIRIVKGLAVYTGDFTVPISALTLTSSEGSNIQAIPEGYTKLLFVPDPNNILNPEVEEPQVPEPPPVPEVKSGDVFVWGRPNRGGSSEGEDDNDDDSGDFDKITQNINAKKIYSTQRAFAALTQEGDVWIWGNTNYGGSVEYDSGTGEVTKIEELSSVKEIYSTNQAFAALTESGDVWIWGNPEYGGSSEYTEGNGNVSKIEELSSVKAIYSTDYAFAAVNNDGEVWVWGNPDYGASRVNGEGIVQKIEEEGFGAVKDIYSNKEAFSAVTESGDVWVWGNSNSGGSPIYNVSNGIYKIEELTNVNIKAIYSTDLAFAAVNESGYLWVWGNPEYGGSYTYGPGEGNGNIVQIEISGIYEIYSTDAAFAAVQIESGAVYVWGNPFYGGSRNYGIIEGEPNGNVAQIEELTNIKAIYSTEQAFAAVTQEGAVWVWGNPNYGGSRIYGIVQGEPNGNVAQIPELTNIKEIYSTEEAFAAVTQEGAVWVWGNPDYGGSRNYGIEEGEANGNIAQIEELTNIKTIYSTERAFAAVQEETGAVWVWGNPSYGGSRIYDNDDEDEANGDIAQLPNLQFVEAIYSTTRAFAAIVRFVEETEPEPPVSIYNIVKPVKSNYFGNIMSYLLFFPTN